MSWSTDDGKHEAWLAPTFADGAYGSGSNGEGVLVTRIGSQRLAYDDWQTRPDTDVIGWTTVCECSWRGPLWTRVASPEWQDLSKRRVFSADGFEPAELEDGGSYDEWRAHIKPVELLADVEAAYEQVAKAQSKLDAAVTAARDGGVPWPEVAYAAGITIARH